MVQSFNKRANNVGLILGGIGLSLLGVLSLAANRIVHVLKGRKDASMSRHGYPSRTLNCASSSSGAAAPARTKKTESCPPSDEDAPFVSPVKRSFMVIASVIVGGRVVQPPIDEDDVVYFDG